ncbi:MAG TPA: twin-arginine translocase TatA/TatE family subunit [Gemmatimonadetes bacterium]|nr:twin-arginine translocase TatA/TatE family subunit [Gemmatimonadota bacterium]HIL90178.1 twin-arginine translocase TatA/TatE family subunit [Gemmatimonadota bacterium]
MAVIGFWEVALLLGLLMVFFGAKKLPQLARGLGSGIRNFKGELKAPAEESKDGEE